MNSLEQIQQLVHELGPATEEIAQVNLLDEDSWVVIFDADTAVYVDYLDDQTKLVFSADLGAPPEEKQASTYAFLLHYNFVWAESGCIKMGLNSSDGHIVMTYELNANDLGLQTLQELISAFAEKSIVWRDLIALGFEEDDTERLPAELEITQGLRV